MSVSSNWARIIRWCEQHAPVTPTRLLPSAAPGAVRDAEAATGQEWPEQLHEWCTLHDGGFPEIPIAVVLPSNEPIAAARAAALQSELTRLWQDWTDELGGTDALMAEPAGSETETYLPAFIPIADTGAGDYLAVDTRSGDLRGCVVEFFNEGGATRRWDSIEAMLDCTATALEEGTNCAGWVPVIEDGLLRWDLP
ncbi:SMI1/KNR4 family protein [Prescottella equi]